MAKRLRILHLSDLHIGKERPEDGWRVERVMGEAWDRNLADIRRDGPIDLICFTGDLAQKGHAHEYARLTAVIANLLTLTGCPIEHFFCVPGNHDIDRGIGKPAWKKVRREFFRNPHAFSDWFAEPLPAEAEKPTTKGKKRRSMAPVGFRDVMRDALIERQRAYRTWLVEMGLAHLDPAQSPHGRLGYRHTLDLGLSAPLHIIGFDSAWLAGDDNDAQKLWLTEDQVGRLMTDSNLPLQGWNIGLVHHPLDELADGDRAKQWLADYRLGLLLHGHQHKGKIETWADPQRKLPIFAAGCLYESQNYPNGLSLVEIELREHQPLRPLRVQTRAWSANGHWHNHDGLYRDSHNGWLVLEPEPITPFTPTPGAFVGRTVELDQLRAALLPAARGTDTRPTVICCAIDGMPGVGKTRLAEQFITEHWLQAYPPPPDTPSGECVLRLVLSSGEDLTSVRSADALLRDLADRLNLRGTIDDIRRDLPSALQCGPGGRPRLVLIENVDSDVQAQQVADLVQRLQGCPVLVTARVRKFGGQSWKRVEVEPLLMEDAIKLLRDEVKAAGKEAYVPDEVQARHLAETLGRLPLALHIAASHLGLGKTPNEFLDELRATGLDLAPAQYGDHGLQVDRARAILRSSFDLSWKAWCAGAGKSTEWQQALVALAHGPAEGVGESLGAAITNLPQAQYGPCVIAASLLSLLEWEWAGEGDTRERRVRLHALIAEFLRTLLQPDAETVIARMGAWFAPRVSDQNQDTMGNARREVQSEPSGLLRWLGETKLHEAALSIINAVSYASANGPYGAWLACFKAVTPEAEETQRGFDLAWAVVQLAQQSGDPQLALETARDYAELAKQLENDSEYAVAQGQIAGILRERGDLREALLIYHDVILPVVDRLGDVSGRAVTQGQIAGILQMSGELEEALRILREEVLPLYQRPIDVRLRAITHGQIADILQERGELEEALRILYDEVLPVYQRLVDVRSCAVTHGQIADTLQKRGDLEEALRIRREEQLPVYERLDDVRSRAMTQAKIADILQLRGDLEEALLTLREEALPVFERLSDVHSCAITQEKIADILQSRGDLEDALRIRREEALPVYERLGAVRSLLVGRANLAMTLVQRGRPEDRPEIRTLLQQALSEAERLRLPEADTIRGLIAQIFGDDDDGVLPS